MDARLVQGLHDYLVGTLPLAYRMFSFLIGMRGDKEKGIRTVQDVAARGKLNRVDAQILLCAIYRRENKPALAVPLVRELIGRFPRNYILRLELSQMYSMAGDKQQALEAVDEIEALKNRQAPGYDRVPWEKIWFQRGIIQFWYREPEQSMINLKKVIAAGQQLDLNTGAAARLRVGQLYDLSNQRQRAVDFYKQAIAFAPQSDAAMEAHRCLTTPYRRK